MTSKSLDFVTVLYAPEVRLLQLQARSMRMFLDPDIIREILIIINEDDPEALTAKVLDQVLPEYGLLANKVRLLSGPEMLGEHVKANGWRRQQTLKLLASRFVSADAYIVLDSKNHFIRPVSYETFVDINGKLRTFYTHQKGSLKPLFINSCSYYKLDSAELIECSMPATTPYALQAEAVRGMIQSIENKEGLTFPSFFHTPGRDVTEFFLYFAYLVHTYGSAEKLYCFGRRNTVTLFTRWPETQELLESTLEKLNLPHIVMFGLHKNRVLSVGGAEVKTISRMWAEKGLFSSEERALTFFEELRKDVRGAV